MKPTDKALRQRIYATMASAGIRDKEMQKDLILQYTNNRTSSSHDMFAHEAYELIDHLSGKPRTETQEDKMRKKIIHYAHLLSWKDVNTGKVDVKAVDSWCVNYGMFHKELNRHTYKELTELVSQFEKVFKSYLKIV